MYLECVIEPTRQLKHLEHQLKSRYLKASKIDTVHESDLIQPGKANVF